MSDNLQNTQLFVSRNPRGGTPATVIAREISPQHMVLLVLGKWRSAAKKEFLQKWRPAMLEEVPRA